ncbi:MAG: type II secretion system F family protein [Candidatus Omnitrophica bacterium]|nr:type II secretion system F family protein [Candidatus Omnitrophota bacterium]
MPRFSYIAKDGSGKKITGNEDGASQEEIINRLQSRGLIILFVESTVYKSDINSESAAENLKSIARRQHLRITANDLSLFCRQLATLLGAGITILEALVIISKQVSSRRFYHVLLGLKKWMEEGLSMHEAMEKNKTVFSQLWINLVESGEASGNLAVVLTRLASYLERNARFRSKILSALIYPVILVFVGVVALLFLTLKIIPTFAELFSGFKMELPFITRMLIGTSSFIRHYLLLMVIIVAIIFFIIKKYMGTMEGRKQFETLVFRLPLFGDFLRDIIVEKFSSEMSTLIESGVPILYALEISERSVGNITVSDIIREIKEQVKQGRSLSLPMARSGFFEPMVVQMVGIGEEVGDLSGMFKKINEFYQEVVETFLTRFTSMFEPLMLIVVGAVIGVMVVGMFMPIFQLSRIGMN